MAPWARLKGVELQPSRSRVVRHSFLSRHGLLSAPTTLTSLTTNHLLLATYFLLRTACQVLQLFPEPSLSLFAPPTRAISCGNPETMQLVYRKLQEVRVEYAEQLTALALAKLAAQPGAVPARP